MAVSEEIQKQVLAEATSATPKFSVDYNDPRLTSITEGKEAALADNKNMYGDMVANTDKFYNDQKDLAQNYADTQSQLQQDRTDFTIETIEQQKDQAHKDYLKEQAGAYVDWRKQSNAYGAEAEQMASAGLTNSGYSESSQVSMYNTYQNRVATARESYNQAVLNYNNAIKDAQLQNNAALAEIAYNALQKQLELSLEGFQYKNQLLIDQANKALEIENTYFNQYATMLDQLNTENALSADLWKFNTNIAWQTEENQKDRDANKESVQIQNDHDVKMAKIEQDYKLALINAQTKADKELAKYEADLENQNKKKITGGNTTGSKVVNAVKSVTSSAVGTLGNIVKNGATQKSFTGSTYDEAYNYMVSNGVSKSTAAKAMKKADWTKQKAYYQITGKGTDAVKSYKTYAAYLKDYVAWKTSEVK